MLRKKIYWFSCVQAKYVAFLIPIDDYFDAKHCERLTEKQCDSCCIFCARR